MLALLLAAFGGGQVLIVDDDPNSGAQFSQIADALAVAGDDDVVLVHEGVYEGFTLLGQGARIFGVGDQRPTLTSPIKIGGQLHGQEVIIDGLHVRYAGVGVVISATQDSVWLEDVLVEVVAQIEFPLPAVVIDDASDVVFSGVRVAPAFGNASHGTWGALVTDSILHLYDSHLEASRSPSAAPFELAGLRSVGSFIFASGTTLKGADGLDAAPDGAGGCTHAEAGHPGLVATESTLLPSQIWTLDCTLIGGSGGEAFEDCPSGDAGEPLLWTGPGAVQELPVELPARHYDVTSVVFPGENSTITFEGTPGELVANYLGLDPNPVFVEELNGTFGSFGSILVFVAGVLDETGSLTVPLPGAVPPGYAYVTMVGQGLFVSEVDGIVLGPPRSVLFLDSLPVAGAHAPYAGAFGAAVK